MSAVTTLLLHLISIVTRGESLTWKNIKDFCFIQDSVCDHLLPVTCHLVISLAVKLTDTLPFKTTEFS